METNIKYGQHHNRSRILLIIFLLFLIALGSGVMSTYYFKTYEHHQLVNRELQSFEDLISSSKENAFPKLRQAMEEYNREIYETGQSSLVDAWSYQTSVFDLSEYGLTDATVGVVRIPDISVEMPLFLGSSYDNLSKGFAQLSQTSMPIGGNNTNCVIAGHRGWKGIPYLRDVEQLEVGDPVYVQNLWDTLEYRIVKILLIHPNETENIYIQEGEDLLTMITCHPYGIGSHRYVLVCERFNSKESGSESMVQSTSNKVIVSDDLTFESSQRSIICAVYLPWICLITSFIVLVVTSLIWYFRKRNSAH